MRYWTHIGDGAYASFDGDEFCITANHHDPTQASDCVYIQMADVHNLQNFLNQPEIEGTKVE